MDATRRDTDDRSVRECRLSVILVIGEDTERVIALRGGDLHQHPDYLRHLDRLC